MDFSHQRFRYPVLYTLCSFLGESSSSWIFIIYDFHRYRVFDQMLIFSRMCLDILWRVDRSGGAKRHSDNWYCAHDRLYSQLNFSL
jgi:hypothetical protein